MATYTVVDGDPADCRTAIEGGAFEVVEVPKGNYDMVAHLSLTRGEFTIVGEGAANSVLRISDVADHLFSIVTTSGSLSRIRFVDLGFTCSAGSPTQVLDGVSWAGGAGRTLAQVSFERCTFSGGLRNGVYLAGNASGSGLLVSFKNCYANGCRSAGLRTDNCDATVLDTVRSEGNNTGNGTTQEGSAQTVLKGCNGVTVNGLYCASLPTAATAAKTGLALSNCRGADLRGITVAQGSSTFYANSIGVNVINGTAGLVWAPITTSYITTPVGYDPSTFGVVQSLAARYVQVAPSTAITDALQPGGTL